MIPICELLLLLVSVLTQCGASEYYVRPTEPTNTSCPGHPCLTLNQYTNDSSRYFKSNAVFKFLPGTHLMNRPLKIREIHNISLIASNDKSNASPQLLAQVPCQYRPHGEGCIHIGLSVYTVPDHIEVCCAVIHLINVTNSTFSDITIAVRSQNVSGVVVQQCSDILIHLFKVEGHSDGQDYKTYEVGILICESTSVVINSAQVSNISYGVILFNTSNSYITELNC